MYVSASEDGDSVHGNDLLGYAQDAEGEEHAAHGEFGHHAFW